MAFVDARLYLSILPPLEQFIPSAGEVVRKVLLGDLSTAHGKHVLATVPDSTSETAAESTSLSTLPYCDDVKQVRHLLEMHLEHSAQMWTTHLYDLKHDVRALAERIRNQKTHHNHHDLSNQLETQLQQLRDKPLPDCRRCGELTIACAELKRKFAQQYNPGKTKTAHLLSTKRDIEKHLRHAQTSSLPRFIHDLEQVLSP